MLKTFVIDINDYGTVRQLSGEKGTIKQIYVQTDATQPLLLTLTADGYKDLIADFRITQDTSKIELFHTVKTQNLKAVIKSDSPQQAQVKITIDYA